MQAIMARHTEKKGAEPKHEDADAPKYIMPTRERESREKVDTTLTEHQRRNKERYQARVLIVPLDENGLANVRERWVYDQLNQPNQNE